MSEKDINTAPLATLDVEKAITGGGRVADGTEPANTKEAVGNVSAQATEIDSDDGKSELPFSKARCIALVATVTGASFLNVC